MKNKEKIESSFEFPMRLVRYISLAGVASRRKSIDIIKSGNVVVNDVVILEPAFKVSNSDSIKHNNRSISLGDRTYVMLNKPVGYLCSAFDPYGDKLVFDLVSIPNKRLFTVGRLDLNSEGLLLLTDDGDFSEKITHPKYGILKKYMVTTSERLTERSIASILEGVQDSGEFLQAKKIVKKGKNEYLFTMSEGKKREVRRLVKAVHGKVVSLCRLSIGKLLLGDLKQGEWRFLTKAEVERFMLRGM